MSCSFCRSHFHDITRCASPNIDNLYQQMKDTYIDMINRYPDATNNYKSYLNRRFNLTELRGVGVKYLRALARNSKAMLIHLIHEYLSSRISEQVRRLGRPIPAVPDSIPAFARDLNVPVPVQDSDSESEEDDVMWYIDTTPSPVTGLLIRYHIPVFSEDDVQRRINSILQMRNQAVAIPETKKYRIVLYYSKEEVKEEEFEECAICYNNINCMELVKLNCQHTFCRDCIKGSLNAHTKPNCNPGCALCREQMTSFTIKTEETFNIVKDHCVYSLRV